MDRCRQEIAEIKAQILSGHADLEGLLLALADWSEELRMIEAETSGQVKKPAAAGAGRAKEDAVES